MPTQAEVADFEAALDDVRTLMIAALVEQYAAEVAPDPVAAVDTIRTFTLDTAANFGLVTAATAVDFYESVRPPGAPTFQPVPEVRPDLIGGGSLNWATKPLLTETPDAALDRLAGELLKAANAAAQETLGRATQEDPIGDVKYARFPQNNNPCAYCVLRASRGAVYFSEFTAERGDHVQCKCSVTPVFPGEPLPYLRKPYIAAYQAGASEADGRGTKALLAGMRRANGSR